MNDLAFLLVVSSALFHALWNLYAKKSSANSIALIWSAQFLAGIITLPYSLYSFYLHGLTPIAMIYIVATSIIHALYVVLLGTSYEIGDLSIVYPVARGTGIAGTAILAVLLGIDNLSLLGVLGVLSVFLGTTIIGFRKSATPEINRVYRSALLVGCSIAAYSLVDKLAVAHVSPFFYVCVLNIGSPLVLLPWMLGKLRAETHEVLTEYWTSAAAIGLAGLATYGLVLWAMQLSQASYVVALREVSIPIATMLGVFLLKEDFTTRKIQGVSLIIFGAVLVKFA
jgi:drug/metabolite transporter (DMT)-like permease